MTESTFPSGRKLEGERFENRAKRDEGRIIKITGQYVDRDGVERVETMVIANPQNPASVGRFGKIKVSNLDNDYRKVSH